MKKNELDISPDFTLEDIRKIRDYDYEMTKDMTREERSAYYKEHSEKAMERLYRAIEKAQAERKPYSFETEQNIAAEPEFEYKTKK